VVCDPLVESRNREHQAADGSIRGNAANGLCME